jgi:hypothetical protein
LPVDLDAQLVPGSIAHALHHLVNSLDLSSFDTHYCNDDTGASAHSPAMPLKAVLLGYSQGMVSSRAIERVPIGAASTRPPSGLPTCSLASPGRPGSTIAFSTPTTRSRTTPSASEQRGAQQPIATSRGKSTERSSIDLMPAARPR